VTAAGHIQSAEAKWVRSLLASSRFYTSDSTWSGYISDSAPHVFGGTVTAQVG